MPAIPGPSQEVTVGDKVYLDGSESHSESYLWAMLQYPRGSHCLLRDDGTATPSFVADEEGTYVLMLETDGFRRASTSVQAWAHPDDPGPKLGEGLTQEIAKDREEMRQAAQAQATAAQQAEVASQMETTARTPATHGVRLSQEPQQRPRGHAASAGGAEAEAESSKK